MSKKKASTGILRSNKLQKKLHKHHVIQSHCMLCKKAGMPERNYIPNIAKDCTGVSANPTIKDGIGGSVGSRADTMKQYKRSENKLKKYLEALKKRNKILYSIANKYVSRRKNQ